MRVFCRAMRASKLVLGLLGGATLLGSSGCYVHHGYVEPDPVGMCLFGACLGYQVAQATDVTVRDEPPPPPPDVHFYVMRHHDDHWHGAGCGCASRWIYGHQAYWYRGHWEYFDGRDWIGIDGVAGPGPSW